MTQITRRLEFDYGHRVLGHEGKCANLHGHRGVAEVTMESRTGALDKIHRVVDFSVVKNIVGSWIDENWDHNMLLNSEDPLLFKTSNCAEDDKRVLFGPKTPYVFLNANPTAEIMAHWLYMVAQGLLKTHGIRVVNVRIYETPNCCADYPGFVQIGEIQNPQI